MKSILGTALVCGVMSLTACQGGIPGLTLPPGLFPRAVMSQDQAEQVVRGMFRDSRIEDLQIEAHTLRSANEAQGFNWQDSRISQDEPVYVATVRGKLKPGGFMGPKGIGRGTIGASEPWTEEVVMMLGARDGNVMSARAKPFIQENPGFTVRPEVKNVWYLGDRFTFFTDGNPIDGALTLTLTNKATGDRLTESIAFREATDYALTLDAEHLPGHQDLPVQTFEIGVEMSDERYGHHFGGELKILRDRDTMEPPASPVTGPDTTGRGPGAWTPSGTADGLEAFAREIAEQTWQGQDLAMTTGQVMLSDLQPPSSRAGEVPAGVKLRRFEFTGTFPKFLVPAHLSGSAAEAVMTPSTLRVVLAETQPIQVVQTIAFE